MKSLMAFFLLVGSVAGGEPYAFRMMSTVEVENHTLANNGLAVPVKVDGKKLVLTALHLIVFPDRKAPMEVFVDLPQGWIRCKIVKTDPEYDLCLLEPLIEPPFVVKVAKESPKEADKVINPNFFASGKMTIYDGRIDGEVKIEGKSGIWTATITAFGHGSSGSPVLNEKGELVALGVAGVSRDGGTTMALALVVGNDRIRKFFDRD